jgi:hypothetical protein
LIHTRELELAARDFTLSHKPDFDLSTRVKQYTNWDGELNEIVHYSKSSARGIDILVNMVLSDFVGDTKNIETIFNPDYRFFGVRVHAHDVYDYCIVCIYAVDIYSTLKSALYTSANIDEEMLFERETLGRKIAQTSNYHYTSRYARDHPNVHLGMYMNTANKSKRKVRLTEHQDGDRTFCVLRRDSLERNPTYKAHDDADYQYSNIDNERFTHIPHYERPVKNNFNLGKGERIVKQEITDYDKELYSKHVDKGDMYVKHTWTGDPHSQRYTVNHWKDYDSKLYYGDLNDISQFEERVIGRYTHIVPESVRDKHQNDEYWENENSRGPTPAHNASFRKAKTPRKTVEEVLYRPENKLHKEVINSRYSFRNNERPTPKNYNGIEVSYEEVEDRPVETSFRNTRNRDQPQTLNGRFTGISAIPRVSEHTGITRTAEFGEREQMPFQPISNYQMVERDSLRDSRRSNRVTELAEPNFFRTTVNRVTKGDGKFNGDFSPNKSLAGRPTAFSSIHKRRTQTNAYDASPASNFDINDSYY